MRIDLTPHIMLSSVQASRYIFLRILLLISVILCGMFFIKTVLFPTRVFYFDASINSLANTISRPAVTADGTMFSIASVDDIDFAKITITLSPQAESLSSTQKLSIKKSFTAFLTPIMPHYDMSEVERSVKPPFPSGSLITSEKSVYVIDGMTKRAFNLEASLLASGYTFDQIKPSTSAQRALYKKAKLFTIMSKHPRGTVFHATDTGHTYRVTSEKTLTPTSINGADTVIDVLESSRTKSSHCTLQKSRFKTQQYTCSLDIANIADALGKDYHFTVVNLPTDQIAKIRIAFTTRLNKKNLQSRLRHIRTTFDRYYK